MKLNRKQKEMLIGFNGMLGVLWLFIILGYLTMGATEYISKGITSELGRALQLLPIFIIMTLVMELLAYIVVQVLFRQD